MKEKWFKSGLFVLAVHFLSLINILLCQYGIWGDIAWLFCQLIICIITVPAYFFVKSDAVRPWRYSIMTLIFHLVAAGSLCLAFVFVTDGWNMPMIYFTELFLCVAFGTVFALDLFVNMKS